LVWAGAGETGVTSWRNCYDTVLKAQIASDNSENAKKIKEFLEKGGLDFFAETEEKLSCAGACKVPLFYVTRDLSAGKPERDCVNALFDELQGGAQPAGYVCLITGILLLLTTICACPLCTGYKEQDMMSKDDA
jgi:hypothetical protein